MADNDQGRDTTTAPDSTGSPGLLDRFFEITSRGSSIKQEIRGGIVAFVAMAYIVVLNPLILGGSQDVAGNSLDFAQLTAVTGLIAGVITILFGVVARLPFALAAGLGMNSFLAVSVVQEVTWVEAMGLVVINGVIIVVLGATGIRTAIFNAVPHALKVAITVGIGLFIAFIGFVNSGFVTRTPAGPPVQLGQNGSIASLPTLVFVVALILIGILVARNVPGGILIGIVVATILAIVIQAFANLGTVGDPDSPDPKGWNLAAPEIPGQVVAMPDFGLIGAFDLFGAFERIGVLAATMLVFTLVFTNFFDAMGTMTGLARSAGLQTSDGMFPRIRGAFIVEGIGAVAGGGASASSNTVFVDAAAGIAEGARTGLAACVTGGLFLLSMFFAPLIGVIPMEAGAAALVVVGAMMVTQIREIDMSDFRTSLPVFLTMVTMPLTYSIANGIGVGFISWALIHAMSKRGRDVHWLLWVVSAGFVLYFVRGPISAMLGG
ncbi:MAG: NCS2 family permease [Brevibacterium sp.]|uniref:NCS2 family permease n=1 Tax=Brevibacterium sp. TaxID=1701 RepID=UPI0026483D7D|nr:NCS2 family permease [Brevibacterium sp.]MDN5833890.1 NCS2 family permease [Brevibacterium sp.]MDN6132540.1 NCS2 family permease [Brevibacterium sp.]MDN6157947.1 NCS2 family permease [Brevibacterium sp.]MDN6174710.1 NCS2 family permease [Brevibacterium sp.]MDN6189433.1 NCS2 family permease [Brevibacterium sp.]